MAQTVNLENVSYRLFDKSIKCSESSMNVYYGRKPDIRDVEALHQIYKAGRKSALKEVLAKLDFINKMHSQEG